MREAAPRLWRWSAPHPDWVPDPEPGSPADWPEEVGSVLYLAPEAAVLIDPLVPDDAWPALDERVAGRPVVVLTTIRFHERSRDAVLERYGGVKVRHDAPMPAGVEAVPVPRFDETMYWLPEPRALVPGDRLIGDGTGGARMCPASWLGYIPGEPSVDDLRDALAPLLDIPVEHVLLSHGEPVIGGGRAALARALAD
jgi:glyoxylase-like metal-dependent hydrolase (beta-lactamase superfamily II)